MEIVYGLIGIILIIVFGLSVYIARKMFQPKTWTLEDSLALETEKNIIDFESLKTHGIEPVSIHHNGLKLQGEWIDNQSTKTLIFMHGHTYTLYGGYKYASMFLNRGYNVLLPNQRYHGNSEGKYCTLGYLESTDLHAWIAYVKTRIPQTKSLGLMGESMGGATVLMGGDHQAIDFIISDCAYSDFAKQSQEVLWRRHKIPSFMIYPTALLARLKYRIPLFKISPKTHIKSLKIPILLVHGDADDYIDVSHLHHLKAHSFNPPEVYICPNANHAQSYETNPIQYEKVVHDFLLTHNFL